MIDFSGKHALVMGLGVNGGGVGVARFLAEHGAEVTVTDLRDARTLQRSLEQLAGLPLRYVLGEHRDADFRSADLVIRNPGVPRESRFLQIAREGGAQIEMEMTLFFRLCPAPIIGITGTRGKTTTTMLTGAMLQAQYPDTVIAGNLRVSALEQLPRITPRTPVVLELSSWQLEGLGEVAKSPRYACVTNLSPDHLDRYRDMQEYGAAKKHIFLHQYSTDVVVLNAADEIVRSWAAEAPGMVAWFSTDGQDAKPETDMAYWNGDRLLWREEVVATSDDFRLPGAHNRANLAAAVALAKLYQAPVSNGAVLDALHEFGGVPDRLEVVRELNGVRFVNDTTATTPTATMAALQAIDAPTVLIAGGADKRLQFDAWAAQMAKRMMDGGSSAPLRGVVLLAGTATERLVEALHAAGAREDGVFDRLDAAVQRAYQLAQPGDTVLLSPGCASFGMFVNEFDRGEQFRHSVAALV